MLGAGTRMFLRREAMRRSPRPIRGLSVFWERMLDTSRKLIRGPSAGASNGRRVLAI
jgi:hypothetical protein